MLQPVEPPLTGKSRRASMCEYPLKVIEPFRKLSAMAGNFASRRVHFGAETNGEENLAYAETHSSSSDKVPWIAELEVNESNDGYERPLSVVSNTSVTTTDGKLSIGPTTTMLLPLPARCEVQSAPSKRERFKQWVSEHRLRLGFSFIVLGLVLIIGVIMAVLFQRSRWIGNYKPTNFTFSSNSPPPTFMKT
ncbi:hypothetical protein AB6A40_002585 [Gnathostoma spinigerum]|uniref:Uncharacterized protein n=1 Tax=Gnathostoma spinigerum TaxID=75299 RepID=A0ABD6E8C9_9BILA